jgi:hypothetical protein
MVIARIGLKKNSDDLELLFADREYKMPFGLEANIMM